MELDDLRSLDRLQCLKLYDELLGSGDKEALRWLARNDRFFLLGCLMMRPDVLERDWCFMRCREVEADPEGHLDLWSRFHYKSTIIAAAPKLYEAGFEIISERCKKCCWCDYKQMNKCEFIGRCNLKKLRAALAEAAGEGEVK